MEKTVTDTFSGLDQYQAIPIGFNVAGINDGVKSLNAIKNAAFSSKQENVIEVNVNLEGNIKDDFVTKVSSEIGRTVNKRTSGRLMKR